MDTRISRVVSAIERLAGAVAENAAAKQRWRDDESDHSDYYPPNNDAEVEEMRAELDDALRAVLP